MELEGNFIDLSNNEPLNLPLKVKKNYSISTIRET